MLRKLLFLTCFIFTVTAASAATVNHYMKNGETLSGVAKKYGVTVNDILKINKFKNPDKIYKGTRVMIPVKETTAKPAASQPKAKTSVYTVKSGDTLGDIAYKYGTTVKEIRRLNNIKDPNKVAKGTKLVVSASGSTPKASSTHVVKKGDTLWGISQEYGVSVSNLRNANNMSNGEKLYVGQKLTIPGETVAVRTEKTTQPASKVVPKIDENAPFFWPADGTITKLSGKLKGTKISTKNGSSIHSVSSGTVIHEGDYRDMGRVVFVENKEGYVYIYGGNDNTSVKKGDSVYPGTEIGKASSNKTGKAEVYFSVFKNNRAIDERTAPRT